MAPKRPLSVAASEDAAATPGPGKRRQAASGGGSSSSSIEPPPSPGKRLRPILLVVLFLKIRPKGRTIGAIPIPASQLGSLVKDQLCQLFEPFWRKLESVEKQIQVVNQKVDSVQEQIRDLTHKVDNMKRSTPHRHKHEQLTQEANQECINADSEGLVTDRGKGKSTDIRLRFLDRMKIPTYHDEEIKSDSDGPIKIGIFDGHKMIKSEPLSKVKVEIMALEGDFPYDASDSWTAAEFNKYRARGRDGDGNVLACKETAIKMVNGQCDLGNIRFREGSCRARKGRFIVGARVCASEAIGVRVQEAIMSPVVVQDRRNKFNEKSHPPKLDESVHRLEEISNDGRYFKRLKEKKICTVGDFLKALNKDPDNLAEILKLKKEHKTWKKMIGHARECCLKGKHKLKLYTSAEKTVTLFFDCVHCLVGATFSGGHYTQSDKFNLAQQELVDMLKKEAYAELDGLLEDHIMRDGFPIPIHMDTLSGVGAGPSYTSSVMQPNFSGQPGAYEVGLPVAVTGIIQAQIGPCAVLNMYPGPSSSIYDLQSTYNNQDQGNWPNNQNFSQNHLPQLDLDSGDLIIEELLEVGDQAFAINHGASISHEYGMEQNPINVAPELGHLEIQQGNQTFEASTSGHSNIYQLALTGAPGSAQPTLQNHMVTALPSNGASEASTSAQTHPPGQWSQ